MGLYCKMSEFDLELYCNTAIVLQVGSAMCWKDCIAIGWVGWQLYCNTVVTEVFSLAGIGCNTKYCIVARRLGRLGAGMVRSHAHDTAWGALRHSTGPCDTAEGHDHNTTGLARSQRMRHGRGQAPTIRLLRLRYDRSLATTRLGPGHDTTAWACLCAPGRVSWASWVLVHLAQFFFTWLSTQYRF